MIEPKRLGALAELGEAAGEIGRLRAIIVELAEAAENALHVLTPHRPAMDGLDHTRMWLREAIRKARARVPRDT
jgi:hypothetical protein